MIETIRKIMELEKQIRLLKVEIDDANMQSILRRFINAYSDKNHGYGFPSDGAHFIWEVCEDGTIDVDWSESWRFGGHDEGSFTMPIELLNEDALVRYESARRLEKEAFANKEREAKIQDKKNEIARLQAEISQAEKDSQNRIGEHGNEVIHY